MVKRPLIAFLSVLLVLPLIFNTAYAYSIPQNCPVYSIVNTDKPLVALTFDDGPHESNTEKILDILKENDASATFFVVGTNACDNKKIIERIIDEGHEIGNHTFRHSFLQGKDRSFVESEVDLCDAEIFNHSEYCSKILRPPGGIYDSNVTAVCAERGYSMVLWSIDTKDWTGKSAESIEKEIMDNITDGAIILMHDYSPRLTHTVEALRSVIPKLKKLGYRFVTVSELIADEN